MRVAMLIVEAACTAYFVIRGDALWAGICGTGTGIWLGLVVDSAVSSQ